MAYRTGKTLLENEGSCGWVGGSARGKAVLLVTKKIMSGGWMSDILRDRYLPEHKETHRKKVQIWQKKAGMPNEQAGSHLQFPHPIYHNEPAAELLSGTCRDTLHRIPTSPDPQHQLSVAPFLPKDP